MKISAQKQGFTLCEEAGYFQNKGVGVMAFDDIYPEGHQSGVSIIMHGARIATNGDIRFDKMPGQWHAVPKQGERKLDKENNTITTSLSYPDPDRMSGFNPIVYPGIDIDYTVTVKGAGDSVVVTVDLSKPIIEELAGQICFLLELFPGDLFGKPWIMDNKHGVFPTQPNGPLTPLTEKAYEYMSAPYAVGNRLTIRPDDPLGRLIIESDGTEISLLDARMKFLNGWFVVSGDVPVGKTKEAIRWVITPNAADGWLYTPVVQVSQVGYHPAQPKVAVIELDKNDTGREKPILYAITADGIKEVYSAKTAEWGRFLRYNYIKFDFSDIKDEGLYKIRYKNSESSIFRIAPDVYDRGVWQPVLEYFLPVQMCHMRVMEKSRLWHGLCHMDDARMAPTDHNHFDGYIQGASTLTGYKPGDIVPGLNIGGWHDAGDDDLRVESQAGEFFILSKAFEEFGVDYDATRICQESRLVEIHEADGKNDILQQIEHGVLSVAGAYKALGRLYRGIIVNSIDQYVIVGDPAGQTDNILGTDDDRWVFTEDNPPRELTTAAQLACAARALKGYNDELSADALTAARELFENTDIGRDYPKPQWIRHVCDDPARAAKAHAATELYLTTKDSIYKDYLLSEVDFITGSIIYVGWFISEAERALGDAGFSKAIREKLPALQEHFASESAKTPYGMPYRPHIWGAGWEIQKNAFQYYFLHKAYPEIFKPNMVFDSLNFVLGAHPGSNNISFASGVGTKSALIAYGWNRADWSFCPGGVISGTALIRPDFPELLDFPFLWQQTEYVLGGGSSNYMFLVLAAKKILEKE